MAAPARLTELDAVNLMLAAIGEAPVNTLNVTGLIDVTTAKTILTNVSREVQMMGWWFNRDRDYEFTPDVNDEIILGSTIYSIDTSPRSSSYDVVERGGKLYDRKNHTYLFPDVTTLYCDVVFGLDFSELPQAAAWYITVRAARIFQADQVGSDTLHKFTSQHEAEARAFMSQAEGDAEDFNVTDGYSVSSIVHRHFNPR